MEQEFEELVCLKQIQQLYLFFITCNTYMTWQPADVEPPRGRTAPGVDKQLNKSMTKTKPTTYKTATAYRQSTFLLLIDRRLVVHLVLYVAFMFKNCLLMCFVCIESSYKSSYCCLSVLPILYSVYTFMVNNKEKKTTVLYLYKPFFTVQLYHDQSLSDFNIFGTNITQKLQCSL